MWIARIAEGRSDLIKVHPAPIVPRQQLDAGSHGDRVVGRFVRERVGAFPGDDLAAARHLRHQADQVAHSARRHKESGLLAGQFGGALLEGDDCRVIAEDVVAKLGLGHRATHLRRRVRDRV